MASSPFSSSSTRKLLLLFLSCANLLAPANCALPPLPTWRREEMATVIATGVLEEINSTVVDPAGQRLSVDDVARNPGSELRHRIFDGSLRVSAVHKQPSSSSTKRTAATTASEQIAVGDKLAVSFRRVLLPGGMVGAQGQTSVAKGGEQLKIYATSYRSPADTPVHYRTVARGAVYLIEPNGFDRLAGGEEKGEERGGEERAAPPPRPRLLHSRRHGFNGPLILTRDVTKEECEWLQEGDLKKGEVVHLFKGHTYGVIGKAGVAVTRTEGSDAPFFELPADALEEQDGARWGL